MSRPARFVNVFVTAIVLAFSLSAEGTLGVFEGKIVNSPEIDANNDWLYIQGRNGNLRRVRTAGARVQYDEAIPKSERSNIPKNGLRVSARVRVTAQQEADGEWLALNILILAQGSMKPKKRMIPQPNSRPVGLETSSLTANKTVSKSHPRASK